MKAILIGLVVSASGKEIMRRHILSMHPKGRTHGAELRPGDPVFLYEVSGLPGGQTVQIVNIRAQGRKPSWQIRRVGVDDGIGDFETAEMALVALQSQLR
jgi:hypothetical protein